MDYVPVIPLILVSSHVLRLPTKEQLQTALRNGASGVFSSGGGSAALQLKLRLYS
jgi:hypothetical protein